MFQLIRKVKAGMPLVITHRNEDYLLTKQETDREKLAKKIASLPKLGITRAEIKEMINLGRE
jgi:DNA-binding transcriptional regulator YhcF (GntR family)